MKSKPCVLVADDDQSVVKAISLVLRKHGFEVLTAATPSQTLDLQETAQIVIQDMNFSRATSGEEGLALLAQLKAKRPQLPVILMTAWGSIPLAVNGVKQGAFDFLTKPWDNQHLIRIIQTALTLAKPASSTVPERNDLDRNLKIGGILGHDRQLRSVLHTVARVSRTDAPVLILGASGTGKELVAEAIHINSSRSQQPFVKVNLGGIPTSLFESEMFGHVKGAFTDAHHNRQGRFAAAQGGTLFLDEIGDLDLTSQVKLLRVLQDQRYEVLGSSRPVKADVRIVSATNRDLTELVAEGKFREDLLYRVNLITLKLPKLEQRRDDVPELAQHFAHLAATHQNLPSANISQTAIQWLMKQPWPGNIRQLKQTIDRAVIMKGSAELDHLDFRDSQTANRFSKDELPNVGAMTLDEIEKAMIEKSLKHHSGNISRAAESLGLSRAAFYRRLDKYRVDT